MSTQNQSPPVSILSYPSDKNGCGYYRTLIPLGFLGCAHNYNINNSFEFMYDLNYIVRSNYIRFQRQVTGEQLKIVAEYRGVIAKSQARTKLCYELDDVVHEISPSNIIAWQFYTESRKLNMLKIMKMCDTVTFSTQFLKDYYSERFDINNSVVVPNFLPKFLWGDKGKRNKRGKGSKPRILWAGSASHMGKDGDMEFLLPYIKKTRKDYEWVFFGVRPQSAEFDFVEFHSWADFYSYPAALDSIDADICICPIADTAFNYGKSDLKLLEYSALNIPAVYSSIGNGIGPYDLVDGTLTVENNIDLWHSAIQKLLTDETEYQNRLEAGKAELKTRWLEDTANINKYKSVYA
jgi:hypothetical protein